MCERCYKQINELDFEYKMLSVIEMRYINRWVRDITYTAFVGIDGIYKAMGDNGQYIKGSVG